MSEKQQYIDIYRLYAERAFQEGNWIWSRFKIYMTLNAAAFAAAGLIFRDIDFSTLQDLGQKEWTESIEPAVKILFISIIAYIGQQQARNWASVSVQGQMWENIFHWHLAQIEKKLDMSKVDLFTYLDQCEKPGFTTDLPPKRGMGHLTKRAKLLSERKASKPLFNRKDPIDSNIEIARIFKFTYFSILFACFMGLIGIGFSHV